MKKLVFIILMFLTVVSYSQITYIPVGNNRRFIDTTSIDRLGVNISATSPARPLHVIADTVRFNGLDGSGSFMKKVNADGDFILGKVRKIDIEDLDAYEIVYGDPSGSGYAYQNNNITIGGHSELGVATNYMLFEVNGEGGILMYNDFSISDYSSMAYNGIGVYDNEGTSIDFTSGQLGFTSYSKTVYIKRPYSNTGSTYTLELPASPGTSNQYLHISGVTGSNLSLGWATLPSIPSVSLDVNEIAFGDGSGIVGTPDFAYDAGSMVMSMFNGGSIFIEDMGVETQIAGGSISFESGGLMSGLSSDALTFQSNSGGSIAIKLADGVDDYIVELPSSQGGANTYLKNDGSGNLSWVTIATGITDLSSFTTTDLAEGTNLYFTDERAQDAVGTMVNSSLTYTDGTPLLSVSDADKGDITVASSGTAWTIDNGSVSNSKLANSSITVDGVSTSLGGSVTTIGFTITIVGVQATIADATNYYMGATTQGTGTTADVNRIYIPTNCVLKSVYGFVLNGGTAGTNESGTFYIRKNNTTDVTVSSSVTTNSTQNTFSGTGLSQSYSAGDYLEAKWLTPTYATNPSNCRFTVTLYFEKI